MEHKKPDTEYRLSDSMSGSSRPDTTVGYVLIEIRSAVACVEGRSTGTRYGVMAVLRNVLRTRNEDEGQCAVMEMFYTLIGV